jgi:hypothetical protein
LYPTTWTTYVNTVRFDDIGAIINGKAGGIKPVFHTEAIVRGILAKAGDELV